MNYPVWDVPIGYGALMGIIAVIHVFISHFAIGGGLFLVVTESRARKTGDQPTLDFLARLSKFFALTTLVAGALTGVGIWFIIGLLNPVATEALIHNYVWGWAIEWTFFVIEITAALLYYYGWQRLSATAHLTIGWIYFVAAWLSLVIINGIITFMLTPGPWLANGEFWTGFFNPTYWPSLVMRTGVCIMLAGLYALLVAARYDTGDFKRRLARETTVWGLLGLVITAAGQAWYWRAIPAAITIKATQVMPVPMQALRASVWLAAFIAAWLVVARAMARRLPVLIAVILLLTGLAWFGEFEMFREALRKPYVITGYIYGNGVEVALTDRYKTEGYAAQIAYKTNDEGADLFRHSCRSCHTIDGYHALRPAFDGTDRAFIAAIVRGAHLLKGNMPPFLGTRAEADEIAGYLYNRLPHRSLIALCKETGEDLGRKTYTVRCAGCHLPGSPGDKSKSFAGQSADDLNTLLDNSTNFGEGMPEYTGPPEERAALVAYLQTLGKQVKK